MSRETGGKPGDVRKSALWGSGNRGGEHRSNALWGKGGRGAVVTLVMGLVLSLAAGAASVQAASAGGSSLPPTYVEPGLLDRADQNPHKMFKLIIQSGVGAYAAEKSFDDAEDEDDRELLMDEDEARRAEQKANVLSLKAKTKKERERARDMRAQLKKVQRTLDDLRDRLRGDLDDKYEFIKGVSVEMSGRRLEKLARKPGLIITEDVPVRLSVPGGLAGLIGPELWQAASGLVPLFVSNGKAPAPAPAIAIVDSGIDANRSDFSGGARVIEQEVITSLQPNSPGDGRGHGTFVASIAAGSAPGRLGASPTSQIIDVDVMDDNGMALTSDVIAGAEWIYEHRKQLNIRVANFSLHSARPSNFTKDPLNRAVERLWFGGVVVVTAAGNYGTSNGPSGVKFAPANDPFVITVGALDLNGSLKSSDHEVPSWSAYGRTYDGFLKPELSVSGRNMLGAVPAGSTLAAEKPASIVAGGYMRLSGTSFAAPVAAGAAAQILAWHPDWTPDQVKGALMATARPLSSRKVRDFAGGVGEINAWQAALLTAPPNPNAALNAFVRTDPSTGALAFDAVSWSDAAHASVSWDAVSWSDVSWSDVSWSDVSWSDVSWADVSWSDVSWTDVSWTDVSWADVSWADEAAAADTGAEEVTMTEAELQAALLADPDLYPTPPVVEAVDLVTEAEPVAGATAEPIVAPVIEAPLLDSSPAPISGP
jgi:serine protease AprX